MAGYCMRLTSGSWLRSGRRFQGHGAFGGLRLVGYVKEAAPFLKKYDEKAFCRKVVHYCYGNYPGIIPMELVETLKEIQEA